MRKILSVIVAMATFFIFQTKTEAIMNFSLGEPATGLAGNSMGDIVYDGKYIWVGTGNGLSYSPDSGKTWFTYNNTNGLNATDISALGVLDSTLWVACAYSKIIEGEPIPYGRGFNKSTNRGRDWESYIPKQVDFAGMIAYDMAFDDSPVWAACWYGGLIHSRMTKDSLGNDTLIWENVFVSDAARQDYEGGFYQHLDNRFFSVAVDTDCPKEKKLKNSINDIAYDGRLIWVATQNGLYTSADTGKTWFPFDTSNGLNANGVYSLTGYTSFSGNDTTSFLYVGVYTGEKTYELPLVSSLTGEGFNYTSNYGVAWDTSRPEQATNLNKFAYNIAIADTVVWSACGKGGLIRSFDQGKTWENVFVDTSAKLRYEEGNLQNRDIFISLAVDTFSLDTTIIWAGTADGLYKFVYTTSDSADTVIYFLEGSELSHLVDSLDFWDGELHILGANTSFNCTYGDINMNHITYESADAALFARYFVYGLSVFSIDQDEQICATDVNEDGKTLTLVDLVYLVRIIQRDATPGDYDHLGPSSDIANVIVSDGRITVECASAIGGLLFEFDGAVTPTLLNTDMELLSNEGKVLVWSSAGNSINAGASEVLTVSGAQHDFHALSLVSVIAVDREGRDLATTITTYPTYPKSVLSLGIQKYDQNKIIWASVCNEALGVSSCSTYKSTDGGETWSSYLGGVWVRDFAFQGPTVWAATDQGLKRTRDGGIYWENFEILDTLKQRIIPSNFTSVCVVDSTIWAGTVDGLVKSKDDGKTWQVIKFAQSFKKAIWAGSAAGIFKFIYNYRDDFDTVLNYNYYSNDITGDFVVSTAIQEHNGKKTVWAGTQPAYSGAYGASISTNDGDSWSITLGGDRVWNFAFDDSVVWAATSSGLKRSYDGGKNWDVFNYMKDKDEITQNGIFSSEFTSVTVIDGEVWAGNAEGLVRAPKDVKPGEGTLWNVFRTSVPIGTKGSETAYAYPSPFSPMLSTGGVLRIHYKPQKDGPVTIKIYDFAMNLVTTLVDNKSAAGIDQDKEWNGRNDKGDIVANGVYFFKVEAPGGQTEWGKLVILK